MCREKYEITKNRVCYRVKGKGNKILLVPIEPGEFGTHPLGPPRVMKLVYVKDGKVGKYDAMVKIGNAIFKIRTLYQGDDKQWLEHGRKWPESEWRNVVKGMIKE